MSAFFKYLASKTYQAAPLATVACFSVSNKHSLQTAKCKEAASATEDTFFEYFPKSQLHQPKRPYPAWDDDWDEKHRDRKENGVTRHIILIRHGQYDETFKDDEKRKLTELGRKQAHLTGERLAEMISGIDDKFKSVPVGNIYVSDMTRAKETATIISSHLPSYIFRHDPDARLNEGIPAQIIPSRPELDIEEDLAKNGPRIEQAFKHYIHRSTDNGSRRTHVNKNEKHEVEIIVCHGNVIRYFFCRALQLPPEAWLRMSTYNCSLTYLMIKPSGTVSCRMLGDIGHLGYGKSTFSMNHGFIP